jgi:hypothetical protein
MTTITDNLRDAAYIAIGMGVITVNRVQARREELRKQFDEAIKQAEAQLAPVVGPIVGTVEGAVRDAKALLQQGR